LAVSPQLIERREFKYLIDRVTAARVRAAIKPFCVLDPFAAKQATGNYTIRSLYLDTPNLALYHANEQEVRNRFKLRIRSYPGVSDSNTFFEVKRRFLDVIVKERGIAPTRWPSVLEGHDEPAAAQQMEQPACRSFVSLVRSHACSPVTLVDYEREPWASTIDDYARITFDTRIRCQPTSRLTLDADEGAWRCVDGSEDFHDSRARTVLELKFTEAVPSWLVSIVRALDLQRLSFAKYGRAVRSWREERPMDRVARTGWGG